jgi:hypothetical protein
MRTIQSTNQIASSGTFQEFPDAFAGVSVPDAFACESGVGVIGGTSDGIGVGGQWSAIFSAALAADLSEVAGIVEISSASSASIVGHADRIVGAIGGSWLVAGVYQTVDWLSAIRGAFGNAIAAAVGDLAAVSLRTSSAH